MRVLPDELSAEQILNGEYPFPPSPLFSVTYDDAGLAADRLTPPPPPGVHPRILMGPDDLPDLRARLQNTVAGRAMLQTLRERTGATLHAPGTWENELFGALAASDLPTAQSILDSGQTPSYPPGHYQPHILYALVMEAFDACVFEDGERGQKVASAVAGYAALVEPLLERVLREPLSDDVWRVKVAGVVTGKWSESQGLRDLLGGHLLGYAYDFAAPFMTDAQREQVRRIIATATHGKIFLGANLPRHWAQLELDFSARWGSRFSRWRLKERKGMTPASTAWRWISPAIF